MYQAAHPCVGHITDLAQFSIQLHSIQLCRASVHSIASRCAELSIQMSRVQHPAVPISSCLCDNQHQPKQSPTPGWAASRCTGLDTQLCHLQMSMQTSASTCVRFTTQLCQAPDAEELSTSPRRAQHQAWQDSAVQSSASNHAKVISSCAKLLIPKPTDTTQLPAVQHPAVQSIQAQHETSRI